MKTLRRPALLLVICALLPALAALAASRPNAGAVIISVSPAGSDSAAGTPGYPFRTLTRAQQAVRLFNKDHDVTVQLANGAYRLPRTLRFTASDGGQGNHSVLWTAAPGAHPVISGAIRITGWKLFDSSRNIYVANTPLHLDSRELWVNGKLVHVGSIQIPRSDASFTMQGILLHGAKYDYLAKLLEQDRLELRATGFFTMRISPVARISGNTLLMQQPAWSSNIWGYDTIDTPYHPELSHLYLANSLAFLSQAFNWYIDPARGKLYLRLPQQTNPAALDVELPRLTVLLSVGNSLSAPVHDLEFRDLTFSYTSWSGPSTSQGYASQQSGSYLAGLSPYYPSDPLKTCTHGCPAFESMRSLWNQMPASVQVSAAERVTFRHNIFAHLGQYALGIGNDSDATLSGTGLGASDIAVVANLFYDNAGGAILAGGVRRDAHHPRDPRQVNRDLIIRSNQICSVSEDYLDNSAILATYFMGAVILHNDISAVPYDAIDIGYGWGINDAGGNANYRNRMRGYEFPQNPVYSTPTTYRDVVVASNRINDAKRLFHDGGAIYNLSASPGTLITENYIYNNHQRIALYLDEGSRYITVRRNVVRDPGGEWLNINTVHSIYPLRVSPNNTAIGNWHDSSKTGGMWTNYENDLILNDHLITGEQWPADAQAIMHNSGIEPSLAPPDTTACKDQ